MEAGPGSVEQPGAAAQEQDRGRSVAAAPAQGPDQMKATDIGKTVFGDDEIELAFGRLPEGGRGAGYTLDADAIGLEGADDLVLGRHARIGDQDLQGVDMRAAPRSLKPVTRARRGGRARQDRCSRSRGQAVWARQWKLCRAQANAGMGRRWQLPDSQTIESRHLGQGTEQVGGKLLDGWRRARRARRACIARQGAGSRGAGRNIDGPDPAIAKIVGGKEGGQIEGVEAGNRRRRRFADARIVAPGRQGDPRCHDRDRPFLGFGSRNGAPGREQW